MQVQWAEGTAGDAEHTGQDSISHYSTPAETGRHDTPVNLCPKTQTWSMQCESEESAADGMQKFY